MRLGRVLLFFCIGLLVFVVGGNVYFFLKKNEQVKKDSVIVENQLQGFQVEVNPRYKAKELDLLLAKNYKKKVGLVLVSELNRMPRSETGSLGGEMDAETNQMKFNIMSDYSSNNETVYLYLYPYLKYCLSDPDQTNAWLSRLFSYELLKAIIARDNRYLFSADQQVTVSSEMIKQFVKEYPLILVTEK